MSRAAVVVIALVLALAAVPVAGAARAISDDPTCRDLAAQGSEAIPGDNCFPGSTLRRALVAGLLYISVGFAALAALAGGIAAIRGSRGILTLLVALAAVGMFFAAYGAARI